MQPVVALVVAAGSGSRLGAGIPKALVELDGASLLRRSIDTMVDAGATAIWCTIPVAHEGAFARAVEGCAIPVRLVPGGRERQDSVRLGLEAMAADVPEDAVVLIHDAARALVPVDVVAGVVDAVVSGAAVAIPVVPVVDSLREVEGADSSVADRSRLRAVQTPQGATLGMYLEAHRSLARSGLVVTDDAAAVELLGHRVALVPGHREAFKITEPLDLVLARAVLTHREHP